jgi:archaellum component FlaC
MSESLQLDQNEFRFEQILKEQDRVAEILTGSEETETELLRRIEKLEKEVKDLRYLMSQPRLTRT